MIGPVFYSDVALSFTGTGTVISGVAKGFGEAAGGVAQGFGTAAKGAEVGLGSAVQGAEIGVGSAVQGAQTAATGIISEGLRNVGQVGSAAIEGASQLARTSAQVLTAPPPVALPPGVVAYGNVPAGGVPRVGYNVQGGWTSMLR